MGLDKKAEGGQLRFVLLSELGKSVVQAVDAATVEKVLASCSK